MLNTLGKDIFINAWGFALLLMFLMLAFIRDPQTPIPPTLPPPGNIAVLACWPSGPIDVDLWLGSPNDKPVGYSRKSGLIWSLLRDDLGDVNDASPINCESAFARITPAGEFVVNIHGFAIPQPVIVHIEVALNGSLLVKTDMEIRQKQERTVIRFTLDGRAMVVPGSQSQVYVPLRSAAK